MFVLILLWQKLPILHMARCIFVTAFCQQRYSYATIRYHLNKLNYALCSHNLCNLHREITIIMLSAS